MNFNNSNNNKNSSFFGNMFQSLKMPSANPEETAVSRE